MTKRYIIEKKVFDEVFKVGENVCLSLGVIKDFCENNIHIYEIREILPIIKFIFANADSLYLYLINKKDSKYYEKITFKM